MFSKELNPVYNCGLEGMGEMSSTRNHDTPLNHPKAPPVSRLQCSVVQLWTRRTQRFLRSFMALNGASTDTRLVIMGQF